VKLLELLAPLRTPLSALVGELPAPTLIHRRLACPWAKKGLVMRVLNERLAGRDVDLTDGIKLTGAGGWSLVLPDPDEPLVHLYAEGETTEISEELEREVRELVEEIMQGDSSAPRTSVEASS
jgi:mannose-1-phosphate guanylyltransferase / phosphomannomutase